MKYLIAILLFLCGAARAQAPAPCPCWPWSDNTEYVGMLLQYNLLGGSGPYARWACYRVNQVIPPGSLQAPLPQYCVLADLWTRTTLEKIGARTDTVRNAAANDRSKLDAAATASWSRNVKFPLSDPVYKPVMEEMAAEWAAINAAAAASAPMPAPSAPAR